MSDNEESVVIADPEKVFQENKEGWYEKSEKYWEKQDKSDNGMVGGHTEICKADIEQSCELIAKYQQKFKLGRTKCADCGCGIGRVTDECLSKFFSECDLVDPVQSFIDEAVKKVGGKMKTRSFVTGVQNWEPDTKYDLIWCQWSIMYLTDVDAVAFLKRCKQALNENGIICIKDNIASANKKEKKSNAQFFKEDNGICRTFSHYKILFAMADLELIECEKQKDYPEELLPLYLFVCK